MFCPECWGTFLLPLFFARWWVPGSCCDLVWGWVYRMFQSTLSSVNLGMNSSLGIAVSKINWRLRSLSKEMYTFLPLLLLVFFLLLLLEWLLFASGSDPAECSLHQTSFPTGKYVWPRECSVLEGSVLLALLGEESPVLGWGLGSKKSWQPGFPESQV